MAQVAGALITTRVMGRTRVLLLQRPNGNWDLPKGHVEAQESLPEAAKRETWEETGIKPKLSRRAENESYNGDEIWIFTADPVKEQKVELSDEHIDYRWASTREASSLLFAPLAKIVGRLLRTEEDMSNTLRKPTEQIMFWSEDHNPNDFVGKAEAIDPVIRNLAIKALKEGETHASCKGWADCRVCGKHLGSSDLNGNGMSWPQYAEHYVEEHKVWTPGLDRLVGKLIGVLEQTADEALLLEERETNADGSHSCGVFIPLPYNLAKDFPDKSHEDTSKPHLTLLYAGDLTAGQYHHFVKVVRRICNYVCPFSVDLSHYSEFMNNDGQRIPHMKPSYLASAKLAKLHGVLRRAMEAKGIPLKHHYGPMDMDDVPYEVRFKAHATLNYQDEGAPPYSGPKPTGSWRVTEIECWGHERYCVPLGRTRPDQPTGLIRDPLVVHKYPAAVPAPAPMKEDKLPGGLADKSKPSDFDPKELARGTRVELEHTKDHKVAREVAMDHLKEDPKYYEKLKRIHHESTTSLKGHERHGDPGATGSLAGAGGALGLASDPRFADWWDKVKKGKTKKKLEL